MPWVGQKRVAFVPVTRGLYNEYPQPPDWRGDIDRRVHFDLDPSKGVDVSLRNYIQTTSYGRADLVGEVLDVVEVDRVDVEPGDLEPELGPTLRAQGFDAGALVMLGGPGAGRASGFWARFVMAEGVGVWAMELTHSIAGFADLYTYLVPHDLGSFDNMACACGTHPTAYTKSLLGWLDPSAITIDPWPQAQFALHATSLAQPPPPGRSIAVQTQGSSLPVVVEARVRADQYDGGNRYNPTGIPSEGVIVYELAGVENPAAPPETDPLIALLTPTALQPGQSLTSESGITVRVEASITGGFTVTIQNPTAPVVVPELFEETAASAAAKLQHLGLVANFTGTNTGTSWVASQDPQPGTLVLRGSTVTMYLKTGPMP